MLLQHIHYPSTTPILYTHALHIQELFARQHLNRKAALSLHRHSPPTLPEPGPPLPAAPAPKLLTFSTQPTYTTGLRDSRALTRAQVASLTATGAAHHASPRGGLTTYHGPGQLTVFLITTLAHHNLTPRCYVHFLEDAVIETAGFYGVRAARWKPDFSLSSESSSSSSCSPPSAAPATDSPQDESRPGVWTAPNKKLCSVGIHFRRGVSSFGLGFNVSDEVRPWFDRVVACGIPGAEAVSLAGESEGLDGVEVDGVDGVAKTLAEVIARRLHGVDGVKMVDVRALGEELD